MTSGRNAPGSSETVKAASAAKASRQGRDMGIRVLRRRNHRGAEGL
jgi:hypothetical protein